MPDFCFHMSSLSVNYNKWYHLIQNFIQYQDDITRIYIIWKNPHLDVYVLGIPENGPSITCNYLRNAEQIFMKVDKICRYVSVLVHI